MSALVVGLGDPARGDDGVGHAVARAVAARRVSGVAVCAHRDPAALLDLWCGHSPVVVVDAVRSGAAPGTIHCLVVGVGKPPLPARSWASSGRSTHAFGLAAVIELARALHRLPDQLVVVGVEAASFGHGDPLSDPVHEIVPTVADLVVELVRAPLPEEVPAMCLGELGEVVRVLAPGEVDVRVGPRTTTVALVTLSDPEPVAPGDWLLVHCGYALARLTAQEAAEARRIREGSPS